MITRAKVGDFKPKAYHTSLDVIPSLPISVKDVVASPIWFTAMTEEYNALLSNKTWTLTSLPSQAPLVGCKWIYKTKLNADGSLQRCKARLVAKGFNQTEGIDYAETFIPVVRHTTTRLVLAHVVASRWFICQINVFLNGDLTKRVYMQQPPGFTSTDLHLVCHLHKAIYGLKQAPRSWFLKLSSTLKHLGFRSTISYSSLVVKFSSIDTLYVLVYVDDILITASSETVVNGLIASLKSFFTLEDLGPLYHFLGIQVSRTTTRNMHLSQTQYIRELHRKTNMLDSNPQPTPVISSLHLQQFSLILCCTYLF